MTSQSKLYFEDFTPGRIFNSGSVVVDAAAIKAYAAQFDPQPFHLDEEAAKQTFFKGLAASGWHTVSMTMRLLVDGGLPIAGGIIGAGADEIRWPRAEPSRSLRSLHSGFISSMSLNFQSLRQRLITCSRARASVIEGYSSK